MVCVALVLTVVALSICLVPAGHGSFSAAYGPTATFKALRALLLLMSLVAAAISFRMACGLALPAFVNSFTAHRTVTQIAPTLVSENPPLRC